MLTTALPHDLPPLVSVEGLSSSKIDLCLNASNAGFVTKPVSWRAEKNAGKNCCVSRVLPAPCDPSRQRSAPAAHTGDVSTKTTTRLTGGGIPSVQGSAYAGTVTVSNQPI